MSMSNATTMVPPSYPELTSEIYRAMTDDDARDTEMPPPSVQLELEIDCMFPETL